MCELLLTERGLDKLFEESGRKVYGKKQNKSKLTVKLDDDDEETVIAALNKPLDRCEVFCFNSNKSPKLPFKVLRTDGFTHSFEYTKTPNEPKKLDIFLTQYKTKVVAAVFYSEDPNSVVEYAMSIARHYFELELVFISSRLINKFDSRCLFSISGPATLPFLC